MWDVTASPPSSCFTRSIVVVPEKVLIIIFRKVQKNHNTFNALSNKTKLEPGMRFEWICSIAREGVYCAKNCFLEMFSYFGDILDGEPSVKHKAQNDSTKDINIKHGNEKVCMQFLCAKGSQLIKSKHALQWSIKAVKCQEKVVRRK